jgi:hypothetical protein
MQQFLQPRVGFQAPASGDLDDREERDMARKYSRSASKDVERAMKKRKKGTLRSGRSKKKVTSRKQAIAIGLSEAREKGKKVPKKRTAKRKSSKTRKAKKRK